MFIEDDHIILLVHFMIEFIFFVLYKSKHSDFIVLGLLCPPITNELFI
jgi:hypothetical protein